jgi:hypothetical protein
MGEAHALTLAAHHDARVAAALAQLERAVREQGGRLVREAVAMPASRLCRGLVDVGWSRDDHGVQTTGLRPATVLPEGTAAAVLDDDGPDGDPALAGIAPTDAPSVVVQAAAIAVDDPRAQGARSAPQAA